MCAALILAVLGYMPAHGQIVHVPLAIYRSATADQRAAARACAAEHRFRLRIGRRP